jgi:RNA polymerase-binding transcription factor DksA
MQQEIKDYLLEQEKSLKERLTQAEYSEEPIMADQSLRMLKQIQKSLSKLEQGKYGICDVCGEKIEVERLKIMPTTNKCRNCSI